MDYNYYYNEVMHHEWIISNDNGGYSMGCGNFINKRKYNGLLTASDKKLRRTHLVQSQEEKVKWRSKEVYLDSNNYAECIYPDGYEHIVKTWLRPYPCAIFSSDPRSDEFLVFKEIKMHPKKNIVMVSFKNLSPRKIDLEIRPKFTLRSHHEVNPPHIWDNVSLYTETDKNSAKVVRNDTKTAAHIFTSGGQISEEKIIFRNVFYPADAMRGYDSSEDTVAPFLISFSVEPGEKAFVLYSDMPVKNSIRTVAEIDRRYKNCVLPKDHPDSFKTQYTLKKVSFTDENLFPLKSYQEILNDMYETFILKDDIIAGYPWFCCWGRDTMISMKPLLYQNRTDLFIKILLKYGRKIQKGILPNVVGEGGTGTNYNSVDASLWFVVRAGEVYPLIKDGKTKMKLFRYVSQIVGNYAFNKLLPFFCDEDGLIEIKKGEEALTWMDAKIYNKPVTPRYGKPVEINSLWYNSLKVFESMSKDLNRKTFKLKYMKFTLRDIRALIKKIRSAADNFVIEGHIADRIENDMPVDEFRPNTVIAMSLQNDLWDKKVMENTFDIVKNELLTPYGLRTLTPRNSSFKKKYIGNQTQLDMAYHQGTVWAWLLGPFAETYYKLNRKSMKKSEIKSTIELFMAKFKEGILKGHISSVAEIWDGDKPHFPKGCPAQAWSVSGIMNAENIFKKPGRKK